MFALHRHSVGPIPVTLHAIPIASFRFQQVMVTIFEDFLEWMIVSIDNLLILATDYQDLYDKVVLVFRRCVKHNVFLKSVKFIGFECTKGSFKITDERKQQIQQIPRPITKKACKVYSAQQSSAASSSPIIPCVSKPSML